MTIRLDFNTKSSSTARISFQKLFESVTVFNVLQENQWFIKFVLVVLSC